MESKVKMLFLSMLQEVLFMKISYISDFCK